MQYLRRTVWYIAGRLFVICLVVGLVVTVFYYAMNLSNIQIILKDGMAARAKVIMMDDADAEILKKYFQPSYLENDPDLKAAMQGNSAYADYKVRGIDHRMDMSFFWVWPWDNTATVSITESIPRIDGRVKGTKAEEVIARKGQSAIYPPSWEATSYKVTLTKENGQWKIRNLNKKQPS